MSPKITFITIFCVLCISLGQILFKKSTLNILPTATLQSWLFNGWLIGALLLYGATTLLWIWILRHAPLHLAYPFMGLAFLIVPCLGKLFLDEPLHIQTLLGGVLIIAGVTVASQAP